MLFQLIFEIISLEINIMQSCKKLATADGMKHEVTIFVCRGIYVAYR
jgi:hypothetical protein